LHTFLKKFKSTKKHLTGADEKILSQHDKLSLEKLSLQSTYSSNTNKETSKELIKLQNRQQAGKPNFDRFLYDSNTGSNNPIETDKEVLPISKLSGSNINATVTTSKYYINFQVQPKPRH